MWMMTIEARALFYSIKHFADSPEWVNFNDAYEKGKTFYTSKASNQSSGYSVTLWWKYNLHIYCFVYLKYINCTCVIVLWERERDRERTWLHARVRLQLVRLVFCLPALLVAGIKCMSPSLVAKAFTYWAILLSLLCLYFRAKHRDYSLLVTQNINTRSFLWDH